MRRGWMISLKIAVAVVVLPCGAGAQVYGGPPPPFPSEMLLPPQSPPPPPIPYGGFVHISPAPASPAPAQAFGANVAAEGLREVGQADAEASDLLFIAAMQAARARAAGEAAWEANQAAAAARARAAQTLMAKLQEDQRVHKATRDAEAVIASQSAPPPSLESMAVHPSGPPAKAEKCGAVPQRDGSLMLVPC
jgi:hypothetical protein